MTVKTYLFLGQESKFKQDICNQAIKLQLVATNCAVNSFYLVQAASDFATDRAKLAVLEAALEAKLSEQVLEINFAVLARVGTISASSSKTLDLLNAIGIHPAAIEKGFIVQNLALSSQQELQQLAGNVYDPMTMSVFFNYTELLSFYHNLKIKQTDTIDILNEGIKNLEAVNQSLGLALSEQEMNYLLAEFITLDRNPTDAELMMFAQANSEHCRHKIFNANWVIDGEAKTNSLFDMIKNTHKHNPDNTLSAYKDNAAVITGSKVQNLVIKDKQYKLEEADLAIAIKVETHNHPTAIEPFEGAATGSGGEIRDEAATGIGGRPKMGLVGFSVSNLKIQDFIQPWENYLPYEEDFAIGKPKNIASALDIMLKAPLGAASYNNEFGRACVLGYFRTYENPFFTVDSSRIYGYHKPIMLAGGLGTVKADQTKKQLLEENDLIIVLGGPGMLIGLGGGSSSSLGSGSLEAELDFSSVQRSNPEMQRRCQEVINNCVDLGDKNPILSIHDVGAGGLSNAIPELVHDANSGAFINLRDILSNEPSMSPLEIWSNESQERYVLAIKPANLKLFESFCWREKAPFSCVGKVLKQEVLQVFDSLDNNYPIDIPLSLMFGYKGNLTRYAKTFNLLQPDFDAEILDLEEVLLRLLKLPAIASKSFLITIGDRSVGGLIVRDQFVGKYQIPVADYAMSLSSFKSNSGEVMSLGEHPIASLIDAAQSARLAVAEAITNIAGAYIGNIKNISLSANWMASMSSQGDKVADLTGDDAKLFQAVEAIGEDFAVDLGINIPVGKDSLSMKSKWFENEKEVISPLSLNVTAFSKVLDVRKSITPVLELNKDNHLYFLSLGDGSFNLGASCLAQVYNHLGVQTAKIDSAKTLRNFFEFMQAALEEEILSAYHDISDGGLFITLLEMSFAAQVGVDIDLDCFNEPNLAINATLFSEDPGCVVQVNEDCIEVFNELLNKFNLKDRSRKIATLNSQNEINIFYNKQKIFNHSYLNLFKTWSETSYRMQALRGNPDLAAAEFASLDNLHARALKMDLSFDLSALNQQLAAVKINSKLKVAILREQGVNSHNEMAFAFLKAGFEAVDVHMSDLLNSDKDLSSYVGLAVCGGFSYGDVLGAGRGWALSILQNPKLTKIFKDFFHKADTFALGVCNGAQMLSYLSDLIPGDMTFPKFDENDSGQFEARVVNVKIKQSKSILFKDMHDSIIPIIVSHGEGKINSDFIAESCFYYADNLGEATEKYPLNPNGSHAGENAFCSEDGRVTIMMPHPERALRMENLSWLKFQEAKDQDAEIQVKYSPWMKLFSNAYAWASSKKDSLQ